MARRKQATPKPLRSASLESLAPLKLDPYEVALVGVVRAAVDAVHALPEHRESWEAARASRDETARAQHVRASASLARRTAEAHARSLAAFVKPASNPAPF